MQHKLRRAAPPIRSRTGRKGSARTSSCSSNPASSHYPFVMGNTPGRRGDPRTTATQVHTTAAAHPQVRFERSADGTVRAHMIAPAGLFARMARAQYRSQRHIWVAPIPIIVAAPAAYLLLRGETSPVAHALTLAFASLTAAASTAGMLWLAPRAWLEKLPPGTPIHAEFAPGRVSIGWNDKTSAVQTDQVKHIRRRNGVVVLTQKHGEHVLIPDELAPLASWTNCDQPRQANGRPCTATNRGKGSINCSPAAQQPGHRP